MKKILLSLFFINLALFAEGFTLTSKAISGQISINQVFNGGTCKGKNISPDLAWENAPKGTKSFAVTAYDPDAPTGSGWWHWVVFNIPKDKMSLEEGFGNKQHKNIIQSVTDYRIKGFGGACPPVGSKPHKYIFTVYALDIDSLPFDSNVSAAKVGFMLNFHTLAQSSVIAYYNR